VPRQPLITAVRDPGFTPRARDLDALVDLLSDEELAKDAERAIARLGDSAIGGLLARLRAADAPLRARIVRVLARFAADVRVREALALALSDADAKSRRNAAIALGHVPAEGAADAETALLAAWDRDPRPEMRRSIAASLGKAATERSLPLLREASRADDPELARIAQRAAMMVERTASRAERGAIDASRSAAGPIDVALVARRGLEDVVAEEASTVRALAGVRVAGPGYVRAQLTGAMQALFAVRTMLGLRLPLATEWVRDGEREEEAVARAVASDAARTAFATWTAGPVRYRIAWEGGAHRRAATWAVAAAVAKRAPELINDPTGSLWEVLVQTKRRFVDVSLVPRGLDDPRFAWRRGDVPAASHPTIAAALARVAEPRADDVVWDPFAGSGAELIECARLGRCRTLVGSDIDPRALTVARGNLEAAGVKARLEEGDALTLAPAGTTLIVTNPPMGRRASRTSGLADQLDRFVEHAAATLVDGGRLVWIAPWPARARAAAERSGLELDWTRRVDMGGFDAEMQRWTRRRVGRRTRGAGRAS
jgi:23S rRNA G2445 N2-methylase RlmL